MKIADLSSQYVAGTYRLLADPRLPWQVHEWTLAGVRLRSRNLVFSLYPDRLAKRRMVCSPGRWKAIFTTVPGAMWRDVIKLYPNGIAENRTWIISLEVDHPDLWEKDMTTLRIFDLIDVSPLTANPIPVASMMYT